MNIRKGAMVVVIATGLAFTGIQQVSARGWGGGPGGGYAVDCPYGCSGPNASRQMDEATQEKIEVFKTDTQQLRKEMAMKRAEKRALMSSQNPDPAAVAKVEGELFDLRSTMQAKAKEAGVPMMNGPRGMKGWGGKGGRQGGMKPCVNQSRWN